MSSNSLPFKETNQKLQKITVPSFEDFSAKMKKRDPEVIKLLAKARLYQQLYNFFKKNKLQLDDPNKLVATIFGLKIELLEKDVFKRTMDWLKEHTVGSLVKEKLPDELLELTNLRKLLGFHFMHTAYKANKLSDDLLKYEHKCYVFYCKLLSFLKLADVDFSAVDVENMGQNKTEQIPKNNNNLPF